MENKFKIKIPFMKNSRAAKASAAAHHVRFGKDPYLDWTVILASFIATTALCVSFALALWHQTSGGYFNLPTIGTSVSGGAGPSLDTSDLQKVVVLQSEKAEAVSQYQKGYPGPADPSM